MHDWAIGWMCKGLIPASGTRYFSSLKYPHWLWADDQASYPRGTGSSLHEIKQLGYEFDRALPTGAIIGNEWRSYTSTSPICLCGMNRENFTSTFLR